MVGKTPISKWRENNHCNLQLNFCLCMYHISIQITWEVYEKYMISVRLEVNQESSWHGKEWCPRKIIFISILKMLEINFHQKTQRKPQSKRNMTWSFYENLRKIHENTSQTNTDFSWLCCYLRKHISHAASAYPKNRVYKWKQHLIQTMGPFTNRRIKIQ